MDFLMQLFGFNLVIIIIWHLVNFFKFQEDIDHLIIILIMELVCYIYQLNY